MSHSPNVGPPATPNHSAARRTAITLALAGLLVLAGCGHQGRTPVASGTIGGQRWSVFAYRDNGICMEVQADAQDAGKVCDLADDGVWRTYVRSGLILMGWSSNTSVVRGVVSLRDGTSVEAQPVTAPKVADLRFLVWSLPLSAQLTEAHLLDSAGKRSILMASRWSCWVPFKSERRMTPGDHPPIRPGTAASCTSGRSRSLFWRSSTRRLPTR